VAQAGGHFHFEMFFLLLRHRLAIALPPGESPCAFIGTPSMEFCASLKLLILSRIFQT
jgi:hypothetical protein